MAEVSLEGVVKIYPGRIHAVNELTLTVHDGELLVLVGPSGCGKTTTLRLLAGLETPTRGVVRMGGRVVNGCPPWRRDVAMVFQRPALYPHRTVRDNLAFSLVLRQSGRWRRLLLRLLRPGSFRRVQQQQVELAARVAEVAGQLGLEGVLDRYPQALSGGQQQRVALGRALVRRPGLLLLDEPLSNLDTGLRLELRRELHLLHRRFPATMVYVTHDPVEALTLGDRVAVLRDGCLQQVDRPEALYERPCNRFVAGFLGWPPMSFLEGRLHRDPVGWRFAAPGWQVPLSGAREVGAGWHEDCPVTLGIRPEHVTWTGPTGPAQVVRVERLGNSCLAMLEAHGQRLAALAATNSSAPVEEGQKVMVSLQANQVHLFDQASGLALLTRVPSG
jgi:ABC-type sugar transport system ATPase subunit